MENFTMHFSANVTAILWQLLLMIVAASLFIMHMWLFFRSAVHAIKELSVMGAIFVLLIALITPIIGPLFLYRCILRWRAS
jgi:hypothetical protein